MEEGLLLLERLPPHSHHRLPDGASDYKRFVRVFLKFVPHCLSYNTSRRTCREVRPRAWPSLNGFRPKVTIVCLTEEESECERERQT